MLLDDLAAEVETAFGVADANLPVDGLITIGANSSTQIVHEDFCEALTYFDTDNLRELMPKMLTSAIHPANVSRYSSLLYCILVYIGVCSAQELDSRRNVLKRDKALRNDMDSAQWHSDLEYRSATLKHDLEHRDKALQRFTTYSYKEKSAVLYLLEYVASVLGKSYAEEIADATAFWQELSLMQPASDAKRRPTKKRHD